MGSKDHLSDQQLRSLLDHAVVDDDPSAIEAHLGDCARCQARLASFAGELTIPSADLLRQPVAKIVDMFDSDGATRIVGNTARGSGAQIANDLSPLIALMDPGREPSSLARMGVYEIQSVLGQGGMGVVLAATDTKLKRKVAIKIPHQKQIVSQAEADRFLREAQAIAALRHENLVLMYTVDEFKDLTFHVMELIDGESIYDQLQKGKKFDCDEVIRIALGVSAGLNAAHQEGIVHRDIKPANILVEHRSGTVKVTDFGLAKSKRDPSQTDSSVIMGTPEYMSPEQVTGSATSPESDLFSLGIVLYRLASNRSPFRRPTTIETMNAVYGAHPEPLHEINPEVPIWFSELVHQLLAKNPEQRPESAEAVLESIQRHQDSENVSTNVAENVTVDTQPSASRQPLLWVAGIAIVFLVVALGVTTALLNRDGESSQADPQQRSSTPDPLAGFPFRDVAGGVGYEDLDAAIAAAEPGGTIEIAGDGPFVFAGIKLSGLPLTIRASEGYQPVIINANMNREVRVPAFDTDSDLTLEGLEFRWSIGFRRVPGIQVAETNSVIRVESANLNVTGCRIRSNRGSCVAVRNGSASVQNTHMLTDSSANIVWLPQGSQTLVVTNCVLESMSTNLMFNGLNQAEEETTSSVLVSKNYFLSQQAITAVIEFPQRTFQLNMNDNLFDANAVLCITPGESQKGRTGRPPDQEELLRDLFKVNDQGNRYSEGIEYVWRRRFGENSVFDHFKKTLDAWNSLWVIEESTSQEVQGVNLDQRPPRPDADKEQTWENLIMMGLPGTDKVGPNLNDVGPTSEE